MMMMMRMSPSHPMMKPDDDLVPDISGDPGADAPSDVEGLMPADREVQPDSVHWVFTLTTQKWTEGRGKAAQKGCQEVRGSHSWGLLDSQIGARSWNRWWQSGDGDQGCSNGFSLCVPGWTPRCIQYCTCNEALRRWLGKGWNLLER